jgi:hypothetical protein
MSNYKQPQIRFIINPNYLKEIAGALKIKNKTFTRNKISSLIGIHEDVYQRALYYGYSFPIKIFDRFKKIVLENFSRQFLFELYKKHAISKNELTAKFKEDTIPHKKVIGQYEYRPLKETEDLAEFLCIMCGDGHLSENYETVMISLNPVDEEYYTKYTISMTCKVLGLKPEDLYFNKIEGQNTLQIIIRRQAIHYSIQEKGKRDSYDKNGLIPGDKLKNQIGVPDLVFKNKKFIKRGLKGLYDTDGGITVNHDKRIVLNFENYSKTLLNDFHTMCKLLGVNSTISIKSFQVNITEAKSVRKFIHLVNPEKINEPYRRIWIVANILKKVAPAELKRSIQKEIDIFKKKHNKKKFHYTRAHTIELKNWIEKHYNHFLQQFSKANTNLLKCREFIQFLNIGKFTINENMISLLIKMALTDDIYNKIKLHKDVDEVYQIQKELHHKIIDFVYINLLNSKYQDDNRLILKLIEEVLKILPFNILSLLRFRIAFIKYAEDLITLLREIIRRSDPKIQEPISPHFLLQHFEINKICIPFKYTFLRSKFLPYLKKRFPNRLWDIKDYI